MKLAALITALVAATLGLVSTLLMIRGTKAVDWSMQSWNGQSEAEKEARRITRRYLVLGFISLALAFVFAAGSAILGYLS